MPLEENRKGQGKRQGVWTGNEAHFQIRQQGEDRNMPGGRGAAEVSPRNGMAGKVHTCLSCHLQAAEGGRPRWGRGKESDFRKERGYHLSHQAGRKVSKAQQESIGPRHSPGLSPVKATTLHPGVNP